MYIRKPTGSRGTSNVTYRRPTASKPASRPRSRIDAKKLSWQQEAARRNMTARGAGYDPKDVRAQPNPRAFSNGSLTRPTAAPTRQPTGNPPGGGSPRGGYSRGGGGRGGGGGGGGGNEQGLFDAYAKQVAAMLGKYQATPDTLTPRVNTAVDADLAATRTAFGNVGDMTGDPYSELEFYASQMDDGGVGGMMESQGMDSGAATAAQLAGQSDLDYMEQLYNRHAQSMSGVQQSANQAFNSNRDADLATTESGLSAQRSALLTAAAMQQEKKEEDMRNQRIAAVLQMLSQGWGSGADVGKFDLKSLGI